MRIVFYGTPEFAVSSLKKLVENGKNIVAVVTAPDKPSGRGLKVSESAIKKFALQKDIPVLQPVNLKSDDFLNQLKELKPDLQIIIAFRMLPEKVWSLPPLGTFNLHASLLPQFRGAAPINRAIMSGEMITGVTTFFLQHQIDTGDILFSEEVEIKPDETAGELHDRLAKIGADLVMKTVNAIDEGKINPQPQPQHSELQHAPKIFREDCRVNWCENIHKVYNLIRGLSPYPAAWTIFNGKNFKIIRATKEDNDNVLECGKILTDNKSFLKIAVPGGYINLLEVQIEGKPKMTVEAFLRGNKIVEAVLGK
jgi:methionyl-tRNA formyltransferase